ncbi:MAG TPA: FKBP-type peptidyl-prolyl cis-trans isomerase [Candidatus Paceibacterota bacterium]|nr:FKBP-type peptidyl-prolyl cis-trans isomerase [Candidatus Paceibacterota bacterium]
MNTKVMIIGIVLLILVAGGVYFLVSNPLGSTSTTASTSSTQTTQQATTTESNTSSQVQAQDVTVGTGAKAIPGSTVSVLYVGYLGSISTSTIFDSSAAHGNQPLSFELGSQNLIAGFQIGVNGMKVGGERLMAIPPSLGYGTTDVKDADGKVVIPAGSTIIFDVKLVNVQAPTTTTPTSATNTTKSK